MNNCWCCYRPLAVNAKQWHGIWWCIDCFDGNHQEWEKERGTGRVNVDVVCYGNACRHKHFQYLTREEASKYLKGLEWVHCGQCHQKTTYLKVNDVAGPSSVGQEEHSWDEMDKPIPLAAEEYR